MRRFAWALAGIALAGLGVRLAYGLSANVPRGLSDDVWFHVVANGIVDGRGFSDPFHSLDAHGHLVFGNLGHPIPTAFHLPLWPALLSVASLLGFDSYTAHQVVGCLLGACTVVVIGLIARRLGGERTGLIAAAVAALYLPLAINDSLTMSESLYGLTIALTLLAVLWLRDRPSTMRALLLGAAIGLAALTRTEALLLLVLLAPLVPPRRLRNLSLVLAATLVLVLPWCIRNTIVFHRAVGLTTGGGSVLAGSNLHSTYYGDRIGGYDFVGLYATPAGRHVARNEAVQSARWRRDGLRYASHHIGRVPLVLLARVARTWSVYPFAPAAKARYEADNENHIHALEYVALACLVVVFCLAVAGLVWLRRRSLRWLLLVPLVLVTLVSMGGYGDVRFREAADVALAVLAGVGLARLGARHRPAQPAAGAQLGDQLAQEPALGHPRE